VVIYSDNCSGVFMGGLHKVPFSVDHTYTIELCTIVQKYESNIMKYLLDLLNVTCSYFIFRVHG